MAEWYGKKAVQALDRLIDILVLVVLVFLLLLAAYAYYDTHSVHQSADKSQFQMYKPIPQDTESFAELKAINPDVVGWLTLYGTEIDYPLVQSKVSNDEYLSLNAKREVTASGSLFLDYRNAADFTDFNTLIFGHHMTGGVMFGGLDAFAEQAYFDAHEYGNLFYDGTDHGLQVVAMLYVDAYDYTIFNPAISGESNRQAYLDYIAQKALCSRQVVLTTADHIVVMSTCSTDITNARLLLIGKILDEPVPDPTPEKQKNTGTGLDMSRLDIVFRHWPGWVWVLILFFLCLLVYSFLRLLGARRKKRGQTEEEI
jgi:sortase B